MRTFRRHRIGVALFALPFHGPRASVFPPEWPDVDFVVPYVPFASVAEFMVDHNLVPGTGAEQQQLADSYSNHLSQVTPMARASLIAPERMAVISGELDQLAPVKHGAQLAEHFGARHIVFRGAHLVQKGRARAFEDAFEGFERAGVLPRRR